ncbi:hypothetical protein RJ640_005957 [Escallonia rubra]|uniref:Vesicle-fusing ATPase n=1 Tax=Escallonia rubra TaxID=112253 RepID=A0AA88UEM6_9ASTE|nr:hypothetical protein RJ640_005957 [Escallonia rubra]
MSDLLFHGAGPCLSFEADVTIDACKSSVSVGNISLNVHQMKLLNVDIHDEVSVKRFVAPAAFELDWMSIDLECTDVNEGATIKVSDLVESFTNALNGQVLGEDQIVSLEHENKLFNCTVIRVSIAGIRESVEGRLSRKTTVYFRPRSSQVKVVNGPDLFGKYIGESEKNVREIFSEAIEDHITQEINSLALQARGSNFEGGTGDRVVNQLLTMIDGFRELNNIFLIGTTNRLDLVDQAMLRPGRLELQLKVDFPDRNARLQILDIHCKKMRQRDRLSPDINLQDIGQSFIFSNLDFSLIQFYNVHVIYICIASRTVGWSGAQLEAACNGALSLAMSRAASGGLQFIQEEDIKVLQSDFDRMIEEIDPAISKSVLQELNKLSEKIIEGLDAFAEVEKGTELLLKGNSKLTTCLLAGPPGSGKTTTAALMALKAKVQHVNMISLDTFPKLSEAEQCKKIVQIFENARTFQQSLIILDDIELLLKYNSVLPYCSVNIQYTLYQQLRIIPSKAAKLLVIGTTCQKELLGKVGIADLFFIHIKVHSLQSRDARKVLQHLTFHQGADLDVAMELLDHIPIKKLYGLVDLASAVIVENTIGRREIELSSLLESVKFIHANMIKEGETVPESSSGNEQASSVDH